MKVYQYTTSFFTDKSHKKLKTVEIKSFLNIFAGCWKDPDPNPEPDPYLWLTDPDPEQEEEEKEDWGARCEGLNDL